MAKVTVVDRVPDRAPSIDHMKDGDIAKITEWPTNREMEGRVVQRYNETALVLGEYAGKAFTSMFNMSRPDIRARILGIGTTFKLSDK